MNKNLLSFRAATVAFLATAALSAAAADIDGKLRAFQASGQELGTLLAGVNDEASAKARQAQVTDAMKKYRGAEAALNAELGKINVNDQKEGQAREKAQDEMAKVNDDVAKQQIRILSNKDAGAVVGRAFYITSDGTGRGAGK